MASAREGPGFFNRNGPVWRALASLGQMDDTEINPANLYGENPEEPQNKTGITV
jgi:hypothetical protein